MGLAGKACGVDEFAPGKANRDAPNVAGEEGHIDDGDRIEGVDEARPENRDDGERKQDVGKGHHQIDETHQELVGAPARIAGDETDQRSGEGGDHRGREADGERDPRAPEKAREHVATESVGAEKVAGAQGRRQPIGRVRRVRIGKRQKRGEKRRRDHQKEHDEAEGGQPIVEEKRKGGGSARPCLALLRL